MINQVTLLGNLSSDVTLRHTASNKAVASFNIATDETWTAGDGTPQKRTEFHKIVAWGGLAEACAAYIGKGRQAFIQGRLQTREWEAKDGSKRWTTEIVASTVKFLAQPKGSNGNGRVEDAELASLMNLVEEPVEAPKANGKPKTAKASK